MWRDHYIDHICVSDIQMYVPEMSIEKQDNEHLTLVAKASLIGLIIAQMCVAHACPRCNNCALLLLLIS